MDILEMSRRWKGLFEMRRTLMFTGYRERDEGMRAEDLRVGLFAKPVWNAPSAFDGIGLRTVQHVRHMDVKPGMYSATMGHYRIVKAAYELGARSLLVCEDDVRFLRDLGELRETLDAVPEGWDLLLFDWVMRGKPTEEEVTRQRERVDEAMRTGARWARFENVRSAACYGLSRKGMACLLGLIESAAHGGKLRIIDQYWPRMVEAGVSCWCAAPLAAVQGLGTEDATMTPMDDMWRRYEWMGVRRGEYEG